MEGWITGEEEATVGSFFWRRSLQKPVNPTAEGAGRKRVTPFFFFPPIAPFLLFVYNSSDFFLRFPLLSSLLLLFSVQIWLLVSLLTSRAEFSEMTHFVLLFFSPPLLSLSCEGIQRFKEWMTPFSVPPSLPLSCCNNSDTASCSFTATDPCYRERESQWGVIRYNTEEVVIRHKSTHTNS